MLFAGGAHSPFDCGDPNGLWVCGRRANLSHFHAAFLPKDMYAELHAAASNSSVFVRVTSYPTFMELQSWLAFDRTLQVVMLLLLSLIHI